MNWNQARLLLIHNIHVGMHLDPSLRYRIVTEIPNAYVTRMRNFSGQAAIRVQIGAYNYIDIPLTTLQNIFRESTLYHSRHFNRNLFAGIYPILNRNKSCYFHTIGKLFENAGVAIQISKSEYYFI